MFPSTSQSFGFGPFTVGSFWGFTARSPLFWQVAPFQVPHWPISCLHPWRNSYLVKLSLFDTLFLSCYEFPSNVIQTCKWKVINQPVANIILRSVWPTKYKHMFQNKFCLCVCFLDWICMAGVYDRSNVTQRHVTFGTFEPFQSKIPTRSCTTLACSTLHSHVT